MRDACVSASRFFNDSVFEAQKAHALLMFLLFLSTEQPM